MKISELEEKIHITEILESILNSNIAMMKFYKDISTDEKSAEICEKSIEQCKKGIRTIYSIKHIEILRSLFNKIVSGKESYFAMVGSICSFDKIKKWDNTKKGFQEFISMEKEAQEKAKQEYEEKEKQKEFVKQAQEQGKEVEMVYDPQTKKMKPVIVEEKSNA